MKVQQSGEDYLETILLLEERNKSVRCIDIAIEMGFSKASVSRAVSILKKAGYIENNGSNQVMLTESGRAKARQIYDRHCVITQYLVNMLGVEPNIAAQDACRIEHVISSESFAQIKRKVQAGV